MSICNHKRSFFPPLKDRPGHPKPSDIICPQCVKEERERFYAELQQAADIERKEGKVNPFAPFIKGVSLGPVS